MPRPDRMLRVVIMTLGGLFAVGSLAEAQNAPAAAPSEAAAQPSPQEPQPGPGSAAQNGTPEEIESVPVFAVTSVEIIRSEHTPELQVVAARGLTSSNGWEEGKLVPLTSGTPADGVLDLAFVANAPADAMPPGSYAPIQAILPVPDLPFKAVRVRGATNSVTLKDLHGYAEAKAPAGPCGPCVGKQFVAKGGSAPAGATAEQTVREEDLPANSRILRPSDGIGDMRTNPNRLTILLGEDGRIVDAIWE
jgi:hypothetical protein